MLSLFSHGRLVGERYRIEHEIGHGGMSTVYLARDETHERKVAVKVLLPSLTGTLSVDDFISEIRTTAGLSHPHILPLLDSGKENGSPFYVTPFVRGESLRERLARQGPLSLDESLRIASAVARALAHAHAEGVIHRDVKPGNVLLDGAGNPYLADFGIARALSATDTLRTSTGEIVGTLRYMSPEQIGGEREIDGRTDIYSLACVLFEMLAGAPLFKARSPQAMLAAHLFKKPRLVRSVRADVPVAVDDLLQSALAKEPADRIQTAAAFATRLDDLRGSSRAQALVQGGLSPADVVDDEDHPGHWGAPKGQEQRPPRLNVPMYGIAAGGVLFVGIVALTTAGDVWPFRARSGAPDTTRYVVLPFQRDGFPAGPIPIETLIEDGLRRWAGITVVDRIRVEDLVSDAADPTRLTNDEFLQVARETGAGRLVKGQELRIGDSIRVEARLMDWGSPLDPLARTVFMTGLAPSDADNLVASGIESLLFGTSSVSAEPLVEHTSSIAAARRFVAGDAARATWSLAEAERHLGEAVAVDPSFGLAALWKAQVTSWRGRLSPAWEIDARRAVQDSEWLSVREQKLARALVAIAEERYPDACDLYEELRRDDPNDFAALFGLGECRRRDPLVVPDANSQTGWSFRASADSAVGAYRAAFVSFPTNFRGFGVRDPELMRSLLYATQGRYRQGRGPAGRAFLGYREWRDGSLAFVAVPRDSAAFEPELATQAEAVRRQRRALLDVATALDLAFPASSSARLMLAFARELIGDASALATYVEARTLADDPGIRAEIGIPEVMLRVRLSMPSDTSALRAAVALADSLLRGAVGGQVAAPDRLSELAILLGRPEQAARLSRANTDPYRLAGIPAEIVREGDALLAFASVGLPVDSISAIETRVERLIELSDTLERREARQVVLEQPSFLAFPNYTLAYLDSVSLPLGGEARAVAALASGDPDDAIDNLGDLVDEAGWDVLLARANILLASGQPRNALDLLRSHFDDFGAADPAEMRGMARVGGLVRAIALRAELEVVVGSRDAAGQWARAAEILWDTGESAVDLVVERMRAIQDSQDIR